MSLRQQAIHHRKAVLGNGDQLLTFQSRQLPQQLSMILENYSDGHVSSFPVLLYYSVSKIKRDGNHILATADLNTYLMVYFFRWHEAILIRTCNQRSLQILSVEAQVA